MQSRTISICVAVLAGVTASIGVAIFAPRASADENSALPAGSVSESVAESVVSSCTDMPVVEPIVSSEASSTIRVSQNVEDSKVDSSSSEAANSKTADSSNTAVSNTDSSSSQAASSTYIASDGTKITINYSVEDTHPNSKASESMLATPGIATPDNARPVANDPATTPAK
jgi:hypothetical protein